VVGRIDGVRNRGRRAGVRVISGQNGENLIGAESSVSKAAWQAAIDEVWAVGLVEGKGVSEPRSR
jgi:hypothetical protein